MKAQFKYAFLSGLYVRGPAFAVIFIMNTVFIVLGSLGLLPFAARIVAVVLGGMGVAAMIAANIGSDVILASNMFSAPKAYLYALTPAPRWKTLLASITVMAIMDFITMTFVIFSEVWLSLYLAGAWDSVIEFIRLQASAADYGTIIWSIVLLIAGYLLTVTLILFCVTAKKSILYKMPASGLLAFLLGCGCIYIINILQLLAAPFGEIDRFGMFIIVSAGSQALPVLILLTVLEAAALFILTSKLMERKMNI